MKKKLVSGCYCEKLGVNHQNIDKGYLKLFSIGDLFDGKPICGWCYLHLLDLTKPTLTDDDVAELEVRKQRFPDLWRVIEKTGINTIRFELKQQVTELEPSSVPTRPEQQEDYQNISIVSEYGNMQVQSGSASAAPKKPQVTIRRG